MKTKLFTVEEANQLLPQVSSAVEELVQLKNDIQRRQAEADVLELLNQSEGNPATGVSSPQLAKTFKELEGQVTLFREKVRRFHDLGCELKDLDMGLVDFLTRRGEQIVYLCWKRGEEAIQYWHPLEGGFAGRQPL